MRFAAACLAASLGGAASRANTLVDDFANPSPGSVVAITFTNPNPTILQQQELGILGGERDLLFSVAAGAGMNSFLGVVGGGMLVFGSESPGTTLVLQYDGFDSEDGSPPLDDGMGLALDLNGPGNKEILIDFIALDTGPVATTMDVAVVLKSPGGQATYQGTINDNPSSFSWSAALGAFNADPGFSWSQIKSLTFTFNALQIQDVDFEIDQITITPEPSALLMATLGFGAVCLMRKRRNRPA